MNLLYLVREVRLVEQLLLITCLEQSHMLEATCLSSMGLLMGTLLERIKAIDGYHLSHGGHMVTPSRQGLKIPKWVLVLGFSAYGMLVQIQFKAPIEEEALQLICLMIRL